MEINRKWKQKTEALNERTETLFLKDDHKNFEWQLKSLRTATETGED